jgi:hypothetical protein
LAADGLYLGDAGRVEAAAPAAAPLTGSGDTLRGDGIAMDSARRRGDISLRRRGDLDRTQMALSLHDPKIWSIPFKRAGYFVTSTGSAP